MPITQDRMLALISAAETFQDQVTRSRDLAIEIRDTRLSILLAELIDFCNQRNISFDEYRHLIEPIINCFDLLISELGKMPITAIKTVLAEQAHFDARAKTNTALRNYRQRRRNEASRQ